MKKINDEVFFADESIVRLRNHDLSFLKDKAQLSKRKRARICTHRSNDDGLHEMLIAIYADSYIHPHKHTSKIESFHIIEGLVDIVVFNDDGAIFDVVRMGAFSTGKSFYYRLSDSLFHTLLIKSEFLIVHEVTNGPFVADETILAPFAPLESRYDEVLTYVADLKHVVANHLSITHEKQQK
jgi:cupin fold WbuC family metalloprotein